LLAASPAAELQSSAGLADAISEVKGMVNRAIRRDQWDWLSVRHLFGDPTLDALCRWRDDLIRLRHGVIAKETVSVSKDLGRLRETGFFEIARASVTALEAAAPRIGAITSLRNRGDAEASVREVGSTIDDGYINSQVARAKLESANVLHRATLDLLIENLEARGYVVSVSRLVDAFVELRNGPAIFEVKSIAGGNERSQVRHALSQLFEYRYLHDIPIASLWLVLSQAPAIEWLVDYVRRDRQVEMLWVANGTLAGPSLDLLG